MTEMSVNDPHETVHMLATQYPEQFAKSFGTDHMSKFWRGQDLSDPKLVHHPMLRVPGWQRIFNPIWVFGDGAEFGTHDSVTGTMFGSILGSDGPPLLSCFLCAAFTKSASCTKKEHGKDTWRVAWKRLAWSFNALFTNEFTYVDHNGRKWDPGTRGFEMQGAAITPQGIRFVMWNRLVQIS